MAQRIDRGEKEVVQILEPRDVASLNVCQCLLDSAVVKPVAHQPPIVVHCRRGPGRIATRNYSPSVVGRLQEHKREEEVVSPGAVPLW